VLPLKTKDEANSFLKDLCAPQEIATLAERWWVCKFQRAKIYPAEIFIFTTSRVKFSTRKTRRVKTL
jgi:uncharacterized protein YerC